jgi:NDP-sugar pyrophosphorylase family protein
VSDLADLTAAILAGGLGTRLRSVVTDRPKVLAEVGGRPFLAYLLDQLIAVGIKSAVLCTGYLGHQVQTTFGDSYAGLRLVYSQEASPQGTAGALRVALPLVESDCVLVLNGDSFCQTNLPALWVSHLVRGAEATILLTQVPDTGRYGRVQVEADGRVWRFDEKGGESGPGWINAGIYVLNRRLLGTIPRSGAVSLERAMFPVWIGRGLYGFQSTGRFLDIGTPEAYAVAGQFFARETLI